MTSTTNSLTLLKYFNLVGLYDKNDHNYFFLWRLKYIHTYGKIIVKIESVGKRSRN